MGWSPPHSYIGSLSAAAGCVEYSSGPVLLLVSVAKSPSDLINLDTASLSIKTVSTVSAPPLHLECFSPRRISWRRKLLIDAAIGDVLVDSWDIWIFGPFELSLPHGVASTPPTTIRDIYERMWRDCQSSPRRVLNFRMRIIL